MSIFEYDEEKVLKIIGNEKFEDGRNIGWESGKNSGHIDFIIALFHQNYAFEEIAKIAGTLDIDASYVQTIKELITKYPNESSREIANRMLDNVTVQN